MNNQQQIKHLKELIEKENPAFHRWIDTVNKEIRRLERGKNGANKKVAQKDK